MNRIKYHIPPKEILQTGGKPIYVFDLGHQNIDAKTVASFGDEWTTFFHFKEAEIVKIGDEYFDICQNIFTDKMQVLDAGCGTGRWSSYLATRVAHIHAIDPSDAVFSAAKLTANMPNITITRCDIGSLPFPDSSFDLVMSIGVLHHIPNTAEAMKSVVAKLKTGGYALFYLYYNFDNKNWGYKFIGLTSIGLSKLIGRLPRRAKQFFSDVLALTLYLPFISLARLLKFIMPKSNLYLKVPLSYYVNKSWTVIRNDSRDRFGTSLAQRFSKKQIHEMMKDAGLSDIVFSEKAPYWHALGRKII